MATRDFKIRSGLVVTGNTEIQGSITVGGNTYSKLLDSDNITNIISNTVTGLADSDLKAIADIRNDVDSDSAAISALEARVTVVETSADSDVTTIHRLKAEADSDAAVIQIIKQQAESDAAAIAVLNAEFESTIATVSARLDSDELIIQSTRSIVLGKLDSDSAVIQQLRTDIDAEIIATDADVAALTARLDSDETQLQAIQTDLETAESNIVTINSNITDINTKLDSDEIKIQALGTSIELLNTTLTGLSGSAAIQTTVYTFTATQGQTTFSGVDSNGLTLAYAPGYIYVFVNGVLVLDGTDYTATNGTSINIVQALDSDNTVQVIKHVGTVQAGFDSDQVVAIIGENVTTDPTVNTRLDSDSLAIQALGTRIDSLGGSQSINVTAYTFTSPANDSDFTGTDDNGKTLAYVANKIHVYLNGILLTDSTDYLATDGSTVTLLNAPDSDDVLTIVKYLGTVQAGFDSEQVVAIIGENTSPDIVARLDSDEIRIQDLQTQINNIDVGDLRSRLDSDSTVIQAIRTSVDSDYSLFNAKIALFDGLTDSDLTTVSNLRNDVDSDSIAIQAVRNDIDVSFNIVNNGASAYTFTGDGFPSGVDNPTLYLERGHTYNFRVNASGHPFEIRQASGGAAYSSGVTNNAAQVGLVRFVVPMDAPDTLAYQCTIHSGMVGVIKIGKAGFDSDQIVGIINANVVTDPTINTRLDSDEIKIQALGTSIESLNTTLSGLSGSAAIQTTVYTYTATQGQTAFTGTDDNGLTLSYAPGYIYVFVNGVLVLDTVDYTATDGSTVNIVQALDSDNTVQVIKHVGTVQAGFDSEQVVAIIGENVNIGSSNLDGAGQTQQVFDSFATGDYRSVKYFVSASSNDSSWFATEIIVIHDGTNAYLTEYGTISTHDSEFITFDADVNGGNVRLLGTPSNSLTNVKTVRQQISQT